LQGDSKLTSSSQEAGPTGSEPSCYAKNKFEEVPKTPDVIFHEIRESLSGLNDPQVLARFEAFMNLVQVLPHSTQATPAGTLNRIGQEPSTEISSHITPLTFLDTIFRNLSFEITFVGDITPILTK
jgi:hypothetical protein